MGLIDLVSEGQKKEIHLYTQLAEVFPMPRLDVAWQISVIENSGYFYKRSRYPSLNRLEYCQVNRVIYELARRILPQDLSEFLQGPGKIFHREVLLTENVTIMGGVRVTSGRSGSRLSG